MSHADVVALVQSWAKPIREHVEGSPYQPGDRIVVEDEIDTNTFPKDPETGEHISYLGLHGTVEYLEYSCGCEQTYPNDPMIGVLLDDGRRQEFWPEELKPL